MVSRPIALHSLCGQAHLVLAIMFGLRARNEATVTSDLDLPVLPALEEPFDLLGSEAAAQQIVGRPQIDLTLLHPGLSNALAWEALRDVVVLWKGTPGTYDREAATWRARFHADAPRRREQAAKLTHAF